MNELGRLLVIISAGYCFLFYVPILLEKIEQSLKKSHSHKNQIFILFISTFIVSILYITFIYLTIPKRVHFRLILSASSLIFSMVRFTQDDYNSIGRSILPTIFNSTLSLSIFIDMLKLLI